MEPDDNLVILPYTHLFHILHLVSGPDLQQGEYNKSWDALRKAKSPADLALFAHCKIKEMAERKRKKKQNNKDMEELYCKISTSNRTCTSDIRDKETTRRAENKKRQEETNNTQCEILVCDTLVKHINMNHDRISPSGL